MTKKAVQELVNKLAEGNYNIYLTPAGRLVVTELFSNKGDKLNV